MPALTNAKHERFAQLIAEGKTADEAYAEAGYKQNRGNAATLKANQSIADRVAEILERAAIRAEVSIASITEDLARIATKAEDLGESAGLSVARAAKMDIAKLHGLVIDKARIDATISHEDALAALR